MNLNNFLLKYPQVKENKRVFNKLSENCSLL